MNLYKSAVYEDVFIFKKRRFYGIMEQRHIQNLPTEIDWSPWVERKGNFTMDPPHFFIPPIPEAEERCQA